MNAQLAVYSAVLAAFLLAGLAGIAAYMRSINGAVPNAVAAGIEAGIRSLEHGPIRLLPIQGGGVAVPTGTPGAGRTVPGELAATVKPWFPAAYIPAWSQTGTLLPDGNLDPAEDSDCGETCVAMVVAGVHGVPVDPGGIRQWLHGVNGIGNTDGPDLVNALAHYSTASHVERPAPVAAWETVCHVVASERPVIMLGRWASVGGAMHWQIAVRCESDRVYYVNPWGGTRSYTLHADFLDQYAGQLVVLDSHIHYDCRTWGQPT